MDVSGENFVTTYMCKGGREYVVKMRIADVVRTGSSRRNLDLTVTDKHTTEDWHSSYDTAYIENLTHKTGNYKQFEVFVAMLKSGLLKTSDCIALDLLTFEDLELLRSRRTGYSTSSACKSSNRRYLIVTYSVEFDRIHYPLPLEYCGPPQPAILQATIQRLEAELEKFRSSCGGTRDLCKKLDQLTVANKRLVEENRRLTNGGRGIRSLLGAIKSLESTIAEERASFRIKIQKLRAENTVMAGKLRRSNESVDRKLRGSSPATSPLPRRGATGRRRRSRSATDRRRSKPASLSPVPVEAAAFLGAVAGFGALLLVLFLYLSRKWCFTSSASSAYLGSVCVPLCQSGKSSTSQLGKNLGNAFSPSNPETSSDSEEDALRRLNSVPRLLPDTLAIQTDGLGTIDAGTVSSGSCAEEPPLDQQQCVVEVGMSNVVDIEETDMGRGEVERRRDSDNQEDPPIEIPAEDVNSLEVAFMYDAPMREMTVHVLQGKNYPSGIGGSQVRLVLLPSKKQRRKTRVRQGAAPQYMESFLLHRVNPEDVNGMGARLRVYWWSGRMRRERLLGEARVSFDQINLQLETTLWLPLQCPSRSLSAAQDWGTSGSLTRSDSTGSQQSVRSCAPPPLVPLYGNGMRGGSIAEIFIGLAYNGTTGRLSVEIIKGSHFRGEGGNDTRPPDTYVKLALVDSNALEMGRSKTGLKRAQPNPLYKETFVFQVALFQLADVTLFLSVYNRRRSSMGRKGREMIGWLCLGLNSSGPEELQHWNDMRLARQPAYNGQVQRWHALLRP